MGVDRPHPTSYIYWLIRIRLHEALGVSEENNVTDITVKVKRGEPVERALKRMKKILDKEGTMKELRAHRFYEKPSDRRRRDAARARARANMA